ncbi:MAG: exodeoxyribonuclease III [Planctomycetota bacterium]
MRIATWNVNSIRARLARVRDWLTIRDPDVLCLQETKVADHSFPREALEDLGYNIEVFGQPTYNGVAILSKSPLEAVVKGLPDDGDGAERRVMAAATEDVLVVSVYAPNGTAVGTERFHDKLMWFRRLRRFLDDSYPKDEKIVVCGDFNITFDDRDVWDPDGFRGHLHCTDDEREAMAHLMGYGLHDALRKFHEEGGLYTWWDYRALGFQRDEGMRIDHMLMSDAALDACRSVHIDRDERKGKAPSDHVPVVAELS